MRNHASWGTLEDAMIVFLNRKAYEDFRMSEEEKELLKEIDKLESDGKEQDKEKSKKVEDIVVELDNIEDRIVRLTPSSCDLGSIALSKDGKYLYYQATYEGGKNLWKYDIKKQNPSKIGSANGRMVWDGKQETLYVLGGSFS